MANGDAHANGPGQDADEVGIHQRTDRVIHHAEQQALQHLADTAGGAYRGVMGDQYQGRREQHTGDHCNHGGGKSAEQVQKQDRADVSFLTVLVVGNRGHDQHKHQDRRDSLQRRDKYLADKTGGARGLGEQQGQHDPGNQADDNLGDQADAH